MTVAPPHSPVQPTQAGAEPTTPCVAAPGPNTSAGQGLTFHAIGTPAPAGSKRAFVVNGRARMVESSKKVRPWWQAVAGAAQDALPGDWATLTGPVEVRVTFYLPRPAYHYRTGKHAGELKPTAPSFCDKKPDADKLERTVLDALKAVGIYRDDCQVVDLHAVKRYADAATGARITITDLTDPPAATSTPATGADAALSPDAAPSAPRPHSPVSGCGAGSPSPGARSQGEGSGHRDTHLEGALF